MHGIKYTVVGGLLSLYRPVDMFVFDFFIIPAVAPKSHRNPSRVMSPNGLLQSNNPTPHIALHK